MEHEELIEKYIQNGLTPEEKKVVDHLINADPNFKGNLKAHLNLKKAISASDDDAFKKLLNEIESTHTTKRRNYTKWIVAASIVLLVGLSSILSINNKPSNDELFSSYFEPYRNVIQPIERGNNFQDEKTIAFTAYEKGEYKKAFELFSKLHTSTNEPYYLFYQANALLKLEKAKEAVPLLLKHLKTKDTLTEKSRWYLALAYLKLNNKVEAKKTLKKVLTESTYKTKEANELLKKIK
ncbi:tetratricopeptide repeat protein [Aureibaculum luteum]|uniref:tetratricopeptide repeat protein n=1 Tax=Aureibaculum luteum TaxID=1548456 RepID=UPI000E4CFBC6|nr:CDC27 family protein [Aureibaculum luteum]